MWQVASLIAFCFHDCSFCSNDPGLAIRSVYTTPGWADPPSHGKVLQKANPPQRVNPTLEKGYPPRRVDPGWLLSSCKRLKRFDWRRADPLRRVGANPGSCKQALRFTHYSPCLAIPFFMLMQLYILFASWEIISQ